MIPPSYYFISWPAVSILGNTAKQRFNDLFPPPPTKYCSSIFDSVGDLISEYWLSNTFHEKRLS